ncbi:hypothetical protein BT96DRAFT_917892 [Gymnopus androsaceus JB14]|uniref:CFEM domain-containing protein n=1 Tax=Gymnopus androsaceus JB14 TaxID=1447944 RepID=A0A6A4I0J8_9AGAR|nr:hypothetical protein BT96DRAFT_917892 [Gymnopus androsaceus JB14]
MPSFIQKRSAVLFAFAALFSFALVRVAEAQASTLPSCATNCVSTATQAAGCTNGNTTCLCQPSTLSPILQCISEGCTVEEKTEANEALGAECNDPIISTSVVITSATGTSSLFFYPSFC